MALGMDGIGAVAGLGQQLISRLWPDPAEAAAAKLKLIEMEQNGELAVISGQLAINKVEAASTSIFVAGWRPFVGWTCGMGFASQFVFGPLLTWGSSLAGHPVVFPTLDTGPLMTLLMGLLGLGGFRSFEKIKRVA